LIHLEIVEDAVTSAPFASDVIQGLCDSLGDALGSRQAGTWVKVTYLPRGSYAENRELLIPAIRPVFVNITRAEMLESEALAKEANGVAAIVAQHLDRPQENIHVIYEPPALGRIAFGGQLAQ